MFQKNDLNYFLVHSCAKINLRSAKNVVFSFSAFWLTGQWGAIATPPTLLKVALTPK